MPRGYRKQGPPVEPTVQITVRLCPKVHKKLVAKAKKLDYSVNHLVNTILGEYV